MIKEWTKRAVVIASVLLLAGCATAGAQQVRSDEKDAFDRQQASYEVEKQIASQLAVAAMQTCQTDANPGLCAAMVMGQYGQSTSKAAPQLAPKPVHPGWRIADRITGGIVAVAPLWLNRLQNKDNMEAWSGILDSVSSNAGVHVGGDYIPGTQDNSIDNSVNVGGNLGDTYGDNYTGGSRTDVGRDLTNGDRTDNSGIINEGDGNRFDSPGPFENDCVAGVGGTAGTGQTGANGQPGGDCTIGGGG